MKKDARYKIPVTTRRKIIYQFKNSKDNTSRVIAEKLGINIKSVNLVLDKYLNRKIKKHQNKNG